MKDDLKGFVCTQCGACCRAPGEVHLMEGESERIAKYLGLTHEKFLESYTKLSGDRKGLVLTEQRDQSCIFLEKDNSCRIHKVKPQQCRDYPFKWRSPHLDPYCEGLQNLFAKRRKKRQGGRS